MALGTRTKFQLEILTINVISGIVYFREIILESSRNVSETTPCSLSARLNAFSLSANNYPLKQQQMGMSVPSINIPRPLAL